MAYALPGIPRLALLTLAASLLGGCTVDPTPAMIANCTRLAGASLEPTPKTRTLLITGTEPGPSFYNNSLSGVLRNWRLDFVEFPAASGAGRVDRAHLVPHGDPHCAPTQRRGLFPRVTATRLAVSLEAPAGQCVTVDYDQAPRAETKLSLTVIGMEDHASSLYEAVRLSDGAVVGRVQNFGIRYAEAAVDCRAVVRGLPSDPVRFLLGHVADRR